MISRFFGKSQSVQGKSYDHPNFGYFLDYPHEFKFGSHISKKQLYNQCAPLATALDMLSKEIKSVVPVLFDKKKQVYIYDHKFLDLLKKINPFKDYNQFIENMNLNYNLKGDSYIIVNGKGEPVEIDNYNPRFITIKANGQDGYPDRYIYSRGGQKLIFKRNGENRFFTADEDHEILHLRTVDLSDNGLNGQSRIQACELQIMQYIEAAVHNYAVLNNQARLSGMLIYKGTAPLSTNQQQELSKQLQEKYQSFKNAGKTMVVQGDFEWQPLSESIKDMDFENLDKRTSIAIYNKLSIPLPLVNPDNTAMANMQDSKFNLYDNAILPLIKVYFSFLDEKILKTRYKDSENLVLTFDEAQILPLRERLFANADKLNKLKVLTPNELRGFIGYNDIEGGDQLYIPNNIVPVGTDTVKGGNRELTASGGKSFQKQYGKELLSSQKKADGSPRYSDKEIETLIKDLDE